MINIKDLARTLSSLTKEEVLELKTTLIEVHGYTEIPMQLGTYSGGESAEKVEEVEEKLLHTVNLLSIDTEKSNKMAAIKLIKSVLSVGLMEAGNIIKELPVVLKVDIPTDEANQLKTQFEDIKATVQLA